MDKIETDGMMMWAIHKAVIGVLILALAVALGYIVLLSLDKQEVVQCEKLLAQSKEHAEFYVTYQEKQMCDRHEYDFAGTRVAPVNVDTIPEDIELEHGVWYTLPNVGLWRLDYDNPTH